jgi:hypothetical protein
MEEVKRTRRAMNKSRRDMDKTRRAMQEEKRQCYLEKGSTLFDEYEIVVMVGVLFTLYCVLCGIPVDEQEKEKR